MGGGDIKLMAAAGVFLGWKGILVALLAGSLIGALVSIALMIARKKGRKDMIPFGPFLCFGIMIAVLYAPKLLDWYLGLFIR
jgi:leader peptidase (prepilin peptidase)/N-methyltransferase